MEEFKFYFFTFLGPPGFWRSISYLFGGRGEHTQKWPSVKEKQGRTCRRETPVEDTARESGVISWGSWGNGTRQGWSCSRFEDAKVRPRQVDDFPWIPQQIRVFGTLRMGALVIFRQEFFPWDSTHQCKNRTNLTDICIFEISGSHRVTSSNPPMCPLDAVGREGACAGTAWGGCLGTQTGVAGRDGRGCSPSLCSPLPPCEEGWWADRKSEPLWSTPSRSLSLGGSALVPQQGSLWVKNH